MRQTQFMCFFLILIKQLILKRLSFLTWARPFKRDFFPFSAFTVFERNATEPRKKLDQMVDAYWVHTKS